MIIYRITNTVNHKTYVGKTSKTVDKRFKRHKYNHKKQNTYLYKAMRKYGLENFCIDILEETPHLDERERFWIKELKPEYNMTSGGEGGDTSSSPNFISGVKMHHASRNNYATYGMSGKKQSQKFHEAIKKSNCCPVICDGVLYNSVGEAQKHYTNCSIRKRLDNPKYPNFKRLRERTRRK